MEIRTPTRRMAEKVYPGLSPRQLSTRINDDLYVLYLEKLTSMKTGPLDPPEEQRDHIPFITLPAPEQSRKIANRVADLSPAIDDQNWAKIERGVRQALHESLWDNPAELRLIARLNDDFDGAENEHRVQNSRITAFFNRLLPC